MSSSSALPQRTQHQQKQKQQPLKQPLKQQQNQQLQRKQPYSQPRSKSQSHLRLQQKRQPQFRNENHDCSPSDKAGEVTASPTTSVQASASTSTAPSAKAASSASMSTLASSSASLSTSALDAWLSDVDAPQFFDFTAALSVPLPSADAPHNPPLDDAAYNSDDDTRTFFSRLVSNPNRHPTHPQKRPPLSAHLRNPGPPLQVHRPSATFEELLRAHPDIAPVSASSASPTPRTPTQRDQSQQRPSRKNSSSTNNTPSSSSSFYLSPAERGRSQPPLEESAGVSPPQRSSTRNPPQLPARAPRPRTGQSTRPPSRAARLSRPQRRAPSINSVVPPACVGPSTKQASAVNTTVTSPPSQAIRPQQKNSSVPEISPPKRVISVTPATKTLTTVDAHVNPGTEQTSTTSATAATNAKTSSAIETGDDDEPHMPRRAVNNSSSPIRSQPRTRPKQQSQNQSQYPQRARPNSVRSPQLPSLLAAPRIRPRSVGFASNLSTPGASPRQTGSPSKGLSPLSRHPIQPSRLVSPKPRPKSLRANPVTVNLNSGSVAARKPRPKSVTAAPLAARRTAASPTPESSSDGDSNSSIPTDKRHEQKRIQQKEPSLRDLLNAENDRILRERRRKWEARQRTIENDRLRLGGMFTREAPTTVAPVAFTAANSTDSSDNSQTASNSGSEGSSAVPGFLNTPSGVADNPQQPIAVGEKIDAQTKRGSLKAVRNGIRRAPSLLQRQLQKHDEETEQKHQQKQPLQQGKSAVRPTNERVVMGEKGNPIFRARAQHNLTKKATTSATDKKGGRVVDVRTMRRTFLGSVGKENSNGNERRGLSGLRDRVRPDGEPSTVAQTRPNAPTSTKGDGTTIPRSGVGFQRTKRAKSSLDAELNSILAQNNKRVQSSRRQRGAVVQV